MKFGQALSVLEAALPEEIAGPVPRAADQAAGRRAADADPDRPRHRSRTTSARTGSDQLVWLDGGPTAAASIGQVHKGRWHDGRDVAVKVQYPGAGEALMSDLRQLARLGPHRRRRWCRASTSSRWSRRCRPAPSTSSTTSSRPRRSAPSPRRSATTPTSSSPTSSRAATTVLVTEWLESPAVAGLASSASGTQEERDHYGELFVRFLFAGPRAHRHAARRPAPRQLPDPARTTTARPAGSGVLDFGAVARLPSGRSPEAMGSLIRIAADRGRRGAAGRAARRGLHQGPDPARPRPAARLPLAVRRADQGGAVPVLPGVDARAVPAHQQPPGAGVHGRA